MRAKSCRIMFAVVRAFLSIEVVTMLRIRSDETRFGERDLTRQNSEWRPTQLSKREPGVGNLNLLLPPIHWGLKAFDMQQKPKQPCEFNLHPRSRSESRVGNAMTASLERYGIFAFNLDNSATVLGPSAHADFSQARCTIACAYAVNQP